LPPRLILALLGAGGLWAASPALAGEAEGKDEIVVSGRQEPKPEVATVNRQIRAITAQADIHNEQLALFDAPVCPGIIGVAPALAVLLVERIRANATAAEIALTPDGDCRPNLLIAFVADGHAEIEKMLSHSGSMLARLTLEDRRRLQADPGPVRAWAVTELVSRDGEPVGANAEGGAFPVTWFHDGTSRFLLNTRLDIQMSVVLFDSKAILGLTPDQIADHATMRGLAQTRAVAGEPAYGTILGLFSAEPDRRPDGMTAFDRAYLRGVYANFPNMVAIHKFGSIHAAFRKELAASVGQTQSAEGQDRPAP
jgi:hypothetical protein